MREIFDFPTRFLVGAIDAAYDATSTAMGQVEHEMPTSVALDQPAMTTYSGLPLLHGSTSIPSLTQDHS